MKRKISALLAIILLACSLFAMPAQAETTMQDGIEVTLVTDKESYDALETIHAKLIVKNTNDFAVENVTTKITAPAGYRLAYGGEEKLDTLAAGAEQQVLTSLLIKDAEAPLLPQTGDGSHGALWSVLLVVAVSVLCALVIRNPQAKRVISLFLCVAIMAPYALQAAPALAQEKAQESRIVVKKTVTVAGEDVTITGTVTYETEPDKKTEIALFDGFHYIIESGSVEILSYVGSDANVVIPDTIEGNPVTLIGKEAFKDNKTIKSVVIPNGVTSIGDDAFLACTNLTKVSLPDTLEDIGRGTFDLCNNLQSFILPDNLQSIGDYAFAECHSLTSVVIPSKVTHIGEEVFIYCEGLTAVTIPDSVTEIGKNAFKDCHANLTIYGSVGSYAETYAEANNIPFVAIDEPLAITAQPESQTVSAGKRVTFAVEATGDGLTYQWYYRAKSTAAWKKAGTAASYALTVKNTHHGYQFYCKVTDKYGNTVNSETATLKLPVAKITEQPKSVGIYNGAKATISLKATGDGLKYQWYVKSKGATKFAKSSVVKASFSVTMSSAVNGRQMYCIVTDQYGNQVKSNTITLSIRKKLAITTQLKSVAVDAGEKATVSVKATGDGLKYQWYASVDGGKTFKKTSVTKAAYGLKMSASNSGRIVYCVITDQYGETVQSGKAKLVARPTADITTQPKSQKVSLGEKATFTVAATGDGLKYQWYYRKSSSAAWAKLSSTKTSYATTAKYEQNGYQFRCLVSDQYGNKVYSSVATLTVDGLEYTITNKKVTITGYTGSAAKIVIPSKIKGYPVTSIGKYAFEDCTSLSSITIPNSVTSIQGKAFSGCTSLSSITIPNSVTSIGSSAFGGCTSLSGVTIPNSVTSIGDGAISGCTSLSSITIPGSVKKFGYSIFSGCTSLSSITIRDGITSIEERVFWNCTGLRSITIPSSVKSIGAYAFYGCTNLSSITIPSSVKSIGNFAFQGCTSLSSIIIRNGVTSIGGYAFEGCTNLSSITIPKSVTSMGSRAFSGCTSLSSITIQNGVTNIGDYAFEGCTRLGSITIQKGVKSIGYSAFEGCTRLGSITIPNSVTSIGSSAFSGCTGLSSITIPSSVTSIEFSAFSGCTGLSSITIPSSVKSIGSYAFEGCTNLSSITIPSSVKSIGYYAFYGCTSLSSIIIPNSVTSIGNSAFKRCTGLNSITIQNGVRSMSIGHNVFESCTNLSSITIPSSIKRIAYYTFAGCTNLSSVTISSDVTSIDRYAFKDCTSLRSIVIPSSVTSIASDAFSGRTNLTICGAAGSYAETYAKNHGIPFSTL